jgi:hypothetical protein
MSFEQPGFKTTFVAGGDLRTKQFHFVKLNNAGQVVIVAAITDVPVGILQNKPNTGEDAEIMCDGISKLVADGTIDEGNLVGTSNDGQGDAIVAGTDTTVYTVGQALEAAAAGEVFAILFNCMNPNRAA